jgi:hypothetical protein
MTGTELLAGGAWTDARHAFEVTLAVARAVESIDDPKNVKSTK